MLLGIGRVFLHASSHWRRPLTPALSPEGRGGCVARPKQRCLGAVTHILWDSFTHESGYVVSHSSVLRLSVFSMIGREFHLYNVLQHASTLLGATVLVAVYVRWLRVPTERSSDQAVGDEAWRYILLTSLAFVSLAAAGFLAYGGWSDITSGAGVSGILFRFVVDTTAIFAVLLTASAFLLARM